MDITKLNKLASVVAADPKLFQFAVDAKTWIQETVVESCSMAEAVAIAQNRVPNSVVDKVVLVACNYMLDAPQTELHRYAVALSAGNILKQFGKPYYATGAGIGEILDKMNEKDGGLQQQPQQGQGMPKMNDVLCIIHKLQWMTKLESMTICPINSKWNFLNGYLPFTADKFFILCRKNEKDVYLYADANNHLLGVLTFNDAAEMAINNLRLHNDIKYFSIKGPLQTHNATLFILNATKLFDISTSENFVNDCIYKICINVLCHLHSINHRSDFSIEIINDKIINFKEENSNETIGEIRTDCGDCDIYLSINMNKCHLQSTNTSLHQFAKLIFERMVQSARIESINEDVYYQINLCHER